MLDKFLGGENGELRAGNQGLEELLKEIPQAVIGDAAMGQDGPDVAVAAQGREWATGRVRTMLSKSWPQARVWVGGMGRPVASRTACQNAPSS